MWENYAIAMLDKFFNVTFDMMSRPNTFPSGSFRIILEIWFAEMKSVEIEVIRFILV